MIGKGKHSTRQANLHRGLDKLTERLMEQLPNTPDYRELLKTALELFENHEEFHKVGTDVWAWGIQASEALSAMPSETALTDEKGRPMTYWGGAASPDKKDDVTPRTDAAIGRGGGSSFNAIVMRCERVIACSRQLERDLTVAKGLEQMAYDQRDKAFDKLNAMQSAGVARSKVMSEYQERADLIADFEKSGVPSATLRITDEMVERALAAANGAMVDTRRHWTDGDRAAVRAMLEAAQPPDRLARAERLLREFITTCEVHNVRADKFLDLATDVEAARAYFKDAATDSGANK